MAPWQTRRRRRSASACSARAWLHCNCGSAWASAPWSTCAPRRPTGATADGPDVASVPRRVAHVLHGADAHADPQLQWSQALAEHADAERRLRRVCQGAVDATGAGHGERFGDGRREELVETLEGGPQAAADISVAGAGDIGVDHGDELALATFVDGHAASYAARSLPPSHDLIILRTVEMAQSPFVGYTVCRRSQYNRGYPREQEVPYASAHRHRRDRRGVRHGRRLPRPEAGRLLPSGRRSHHGPVRRQERQGRRQGAGWHDQPRR